MQRVIVILFAMLLTASLMWPSEGAIHGDGLHLAFGWLITASIAALAVAKGSFENAKLPRCRSLAFVSVMLLLCGIWLSTWHVFYVQGDRRAALNLAFEWSAIGAAWWVARLLLKNINDKQWIPTLLVGLSVGAAIVGIVQHHVTYQRQAEWYQQQKERMESLSGSSDARVSADGLLAAQEFQRMGIPTDGPSQKLFEARLLDSSEPTGPFALANTLGGLLALALVLMVGGLAQTFRERRRIPFLAWSVVAIVIFAVSYGLILTKSRTAWGGLSCGLLMLAVQARGLLSLPGVKRFLAGGALLVMLGAAIGIGTGAVDREVVLESTRSLQFRLSYWMGTAGVIADEPLFGSGPGNFRTHYLKHKVVESSEEILDPHNIVLDAWCMAGMVGFVAICMLMISVVRPMNNKTSKTQEDFGQGKAPLSRPPGVSIGVFCGLLLHLGWRWLNGEAFLDLSGDIFETTNVVIAIPLLGIAFSWCLSGRLSYSSDVMRAALICLFVHLLGAGGLQISVVGLLLLLMHSLSTSDEHSNYRPASQTLKASASGWLIAAVLGCTAGATIWWGLIPVRAAGFQLEMASLQQAQAKHRAAIRACDRAISADLLAKNSRQRKMQVLSYLFVTAVESRAQSENLSDEPTIDITPFYEDAMAACDDVIAADRRSYTGYHFRSRLSERLATVVEGTHLRESAVTDMEQVLSCYPTNSAFWFEYAELLENTQRPRNARNAALKALEIERVNRQWGHSDRYLSPDRLETLHKMSDASKESDE